MIKFCCSPKTVCKLWPFVVLYTMFCISCQNGNYRTAEKLFRAEELISHDSVEEASHLLDEISTYYENNSRPQSKYRFVLDSRYVQTKMGHPIESDSLLLRALSFCEKNASSNAQTKARYLLACSYRDQHQYSRCQQWLLEATENADTVALRFDYSLLHDIYMELGEIYVCVNSLVPAQHAYYKSAYYALQVNDSVRWAEAMLGIAKCKEHLGQWEDCYKLNAVAYQLFMKKDDARRRYDRCMSKVMMCHALVEQEKYGDAVRLLMQLEREPTVKCVSSDSLLLSRQVVECKIRYLVSTGQYDKALACLQKASQEIKDRSSELKWLSMVYEKQGNWLSAYKALQGYNSVRDSVLDYNLAHEMQRYQHALNEMNAENRLSESRKEKKTIVASCLAFMLLLFIIYAVTASLSRKRYIDLVDSFNEKQRELAEQKNLLQALKSSHEKVWKQQISRLESELAAKEAVLQELKERIPIPEMVKSNSQRLSSTPLYQSIQLQVRQGKRISDEDLQAFFLTVKECLPLTYDKIVSSKEVMHGTLLRIVLFTLLQMRTKDMAIQCYCEAHAISMNKARVNLILFGEQTARNLLQNLLGCTENPSHTTSNA